MNFFTIVSLLGGLALFLYGMNILASGLEKLSGGRLERTLEKLTNNVFKSVLLGMVVTAAVQSSSATTVIIVGLVNAKILKLRQAIGVIMGANIGTTVTAHILRLSDISSENFFLQLLKPTTLAPIVAVIGILLFMQKKNARKDIGSILLGFAILFTGMFGMEDAVSGLKELPAFANLFETFTNPILGVLVGALVTAIIQSSSASVGILQALSSTGKITYAAALPIIMGQNIGTCITPILASIGASKGAKRAAFVHLTFNVLGTIIFLTGVYTIQATVGFSFWNMPIDKGGIANFHSLFNIVITILFLPFVGLLEKLANFVIRSKPEEETGAQSLNALDDRFMIAPGLALEYSRKAVCEMADFSKDAYRQSVQLLFQYDARQCERVKEIENIIDRMEDRIGSYLLKISEKELTDVESREVSELLHMVSEFERIGDQAINIMECAQTMQEGGKSFSPQALQELAAITSAVDEILDMSVEAFQTQDLATALKIEPLEQVIDVMEETLKTRHIDRLKNGQCSVDAAFPFVETVANLERIGDNCSNIGVNLFGKFAEGRDFDGHEYIKKIHSGQTESYSEYYRYYGEKYYSKIM